MGVLESKCRRIVARGRLESEKRAAASHLLAFALGREISAADFPAIERIVEETATANYSVRKMIHLVTQSAPFVAASNPERKKSLEKEQ